VADNRLRVLVACGAAAGIAATFNTPIAGPLFAMELILRDFAAESFGAIVLASVTATAIGRAAFGSQPFLVVPALALRGGWEYLLFALLGLVVGAVGVAFTRVLYWIEDACDWLWRGPAWLRPVAGGVLLGGLLLVLPQLYGVGDPVLAGAIGGRYVVWFLLVLLVGKIVAASLTIGIGGSGGVFTPALFIGAMGGSAFGILVHQVFPTAGSPGLYGLIGMGAAFAGATRAAMTAVIVLFELTGQYSIILPLMLAVFAATAVSHALSRDTIYTLKLTRRGVNLEAGGGVQGRLGRIRVGTVMDPMPDPTAGDLTVVQPKLTEHSTLTDALHALAEADDIGLPVLDSAGHAVTGWITHRAVLVALQEPTNGRSDTTADTRSPTRRDRAASVIAPVRRQQWQLKQGFLAVRRLRANVEECP
jgi:CIC family chloride channel protein